MAGSTVQPSDEVLAAVHSVVGGSRTRYCALRLARAAAARRGGPHFPHGPRDASGAPEGGLYRGCPSLDPRSLEVVLMQPKGPSRPDFVLAARRRLAFASLLLPPAQQWPRRRRALPAAGAARPAKTSCCARPRPRPRLRGPSSPPAAAAAATGAAELLVGDIVRRVLQHVAAARTCGPRTCGLTSMRWLRSWRPSTGYL